MLMWDQGQVPVAAALPMPTNCVHDVHQFASQVGYPIMVKAVDGGGGRGIRLIREESQLSSMVKRAVEESPSKQVFAEKAAVDGFRHVEVQIIGDGTENVTHLWERECSIQRRYQKVVEVAPSVVSDRGQIARVIEDALKMARRVTPAQIARGDYDGHGILIPGRYNTSLSAPLSSSSTPRPRPTTSSKSIHASKSNTPSLSPSPPPTSSKRNFFSPRGPHCKPADSLIRTVTPQDPHPFTQYSCASRPRTSKATGPSQLAKSLPSSSPPAMASAPTLTYWVVAAPPLPPTLTASLPSSSLRPQPGLPQCARRSAPLKTRASAASLPISPCSKP